MSDAELRRLPAVHLVLDQAEGLGLMESFRRDLVARAVREVVDRARQRLAEGQAADTTPEALALAAGALLERVGRVGPRRVVNATGVVLHTGLGRAPLPSGWLDGGYRELEIDPDTGERGDRQSHVREMLRWLTGAEDALVVNNNAAATLLAIAATAAEGDVIVSRGQLVEIGGSFRMPEVIATSGAHLVEVGATNRVRLEDYRAAITPSTRAILEVHPSNFRIRGFTEQPTTAALAALAHEAGLPLIHDVGSGCLTDTRLLPGLAEEEPEPLVTDAVTAGADLVCFSGDKLLGGPQAGIVVGTSARIRPLARHPLARAVRIDKLALGALSHCLRAWMAPAAAEQVPARALLERPASELQALAESLAARIRGSGFAATVEVTRGASPPGSGSLPDTVLDSWWVRLTVSDPAGLARALRSAEPAVYPIVREDQVVFDVRTLLPGEEEELAATVRNLSS